MKGKLYVVGTPIGNLGDLSPRGAEILSQVDYIAAEDTRVTVKLLNHLGIKKPLISYYEHNLREKGEQLVEKMEQGANIAVVTDAGMPCISDPGEDLVRLAADRGIEVVVVPGPSAAISALAVSGLSTSRFAFEGFLSVNRPNRLAHLEEIRNDSHTLIFYEAPHKLRQTLSDLYSVLGDRRISLCRELTKIYEEVLRFSLSEAIAYYREKTPKGEYVLVVEGAKRETPVFSFEDAVALGRRFLEEGDKRSEAARKAAAQSGLKKSEIYKALLDEEKG